MSRVRSRRRWAAFTLALVLSLLSGCSKNASHPRVDVASSTPSPTQSSLTRGPWFLGTWVHHGVELQVAVTSAAASEAEYVGDLSFRTYVTCHRHTHQPCDRNIGRNGYVVGGLIRFALDANGVGSVIYSNDRGRNSGFVRACGA